MNEGRSGWLIVGVLILAGIIYASHSKSDDQSTPDSSYSTAADSGSASYSEPGEFHGYDCTQDCSGHEAGYQWAEDNDITDEDDCTGNSDSFIEGCKAYVEEQGDGDMNDDDEPDDPDDP